jgi:hypothetical protein
MRQIILDISDNKYSFFMELLKSFDFVRVKEDTYKEPTKEEVKENIKQGLKELKLIEQGKLKTRPAREFLNEL